MCVCVCVNKQPLQSHEPHQPNVDTPELGTARTAPHLDTSVKMSAITFTSTATAVNLFRRQTGKTGLCLVTARHTCPEPQCYRDLVDEGLSFIIISFTLLITRLWERQRRSASRRFPGWGCMLTQVEITINVNMSKVQRKGTLGKVSGPITRTPLPTPPRGPCGKASGSREAGLGLIPAFHVGLFSRASHISDL